MKEDTVQYKTLLDKTRAETKGEKLSELKHENTTANTKHISHGVYRSQHGKKQEQTHFQHGYEYIVSIIYEMVACNISLLFEEQARTCPI